MDTQSHFMGLDGFVWFVGVVEDRDDPDKQGRVRVRCLGFHSENLESIPTEDLPWATVMAPTTTPSMDGLGNTPPFLVEGSWVIGFFRDAADKQQPIIMGSLPGFNETRKLRNVGFKDPKGVYPKYVGAPDTNRLGRGSIGEYHPALLLRRRLKQTDIPIATKPHLSSGVQVGAEAETRSTWDELTPKSDSASFYPYNHVHESEAGHVHEVDDSPGGERLLQQHISGTFTEIHPTGDKVVKVVGDNYEIIAGKSNVVIDGDVNLTITGTKRELVKGDYVLEVEGDFTKKIHKNERIKVGAGTSGGNREEEINGSHGFNISHAVKGFVGTAKDKDDQPLEPSDYDVVIGGNETRFVNGYSKLGIGGNYSVISQTGAITHGASTTYSASTKSGIVSIKSGDKIDIRSATSMLLNPETTLTETVGTNAIRTVAGTLSDTITGVGNITMNGTDSVIKAKNAGGTLIGLTTHTHTDPAGIAGNETTAPNDT